VRSVPLLELVAGYLLLSNQVPAVVNFLRNLLANAQPATEVNSQASVVQAPRVPAVSEESLYDVPAPVLLNTWKHHAAAIRRRLRLISQEGEPALTELQQQLLVIGTELMDLYIGELLPSEIASKALAGLKEQNRIDLDAYRAWIQTGGGYRVEIFPEDSSQWVLRMGDEGDRYVHVHPARWAPATRRVRANVLKTAIMVTAYVAVKGGNATDIKLINAVRKQYLGLSPIGRLSGDEGLGLVLEDLRL
jgi:hypothetical protein